MGGTWPKMVISEIYAKGENMIKITEFEQCSDCNPRKCYHPCGYKVQSSASLATENNHNGDYVGEFYSELDEHIWTRYSEIIIRFLGKQKKKDHKRCGNCSRWSRGGVGAGRGGGYCFRWMIVKHPQNQHHADDCWEPIHSPNQKETP